MWPFAVLPPLPLGGTGSYFRDPPTRTQPDPPELTRQMIQPYRKSDRRSRGSVSSPPPAAAPQNPKAVHSVTCHASCYSSRIEIAHKGLLAFFERGDARRIPTTLASRIRRILSDLDAAVQPRDVDLPGYRLHPLTGDPRGQWSVRVSGNWRIVFRFVNGEAVDVTLVDYH